MNPIMDSNGFDILDFYNSTPVRTRRLNALDREDANLYTNISKPSAIHCKNVGLTRFFAKYLMQKVCSIFKFNYPKTWNRDYYIYTLFGKGFLSIIATRSGGVIPQECTLTKRDAFYQPSGCIVTNPHLPELSGGREYKFGTNAVLMKLQPDFGNVLDLVFYYSELMALTSTAMGVNIFNSHLAYVFGTTSNSKAKSLKRMHSEISAGNPGVFVDEKLFQTDGSPSWHEFNQDLKRNFIAEDLASLLKKIEYDFDKAVGIPSVNTDKKERLITDEVNGNNVGVSTRADMWLDSLKEACDKANNMFSDFNINLNVDWRVQPKVGSKEEQ